MNGRSATTVGLYTREADAANGISSSAVAELMLRRLQRKKRTLLKLKLMKVDRPRSTCLERYSPLLTVEGVKNTGSERFIDELLMQVEAQEEIIKNISNLCDVVRQLCQNQQEQLKQSLFDLPVWASPSAIMVSLSELLNGV